ncbi:MAG: hypothetical protein ACK5N9_07820 [Pirellula sp.]|jgi:hypothetical protein
MNVNRDESLLPIEPDGMREAAKRLGQLVSVISIVSGTDSVQFYAMMPWRPNAGDQIVTQNGVSCVVVDVIFKTVTTEFGFQLVPNIFAVPASPQE